MHATTRHLRELVLALLAMSAFAYAPARAQNVANGQSIYNGICISCHGNPPVGGPEKAANNPTVIANAINSVVPAMSFLKGTYTNSDLADIAAYIGTVVGTPPPPPPTTIPTPAFNYTDLWWNANESGWGFNIIQHESNNIFGVIYTYEAPNRPLWLVMPGGSWTTSTVFVGPLYRVTGPHYGQAFDSSKVVALQVGVATLTFTSQDAGTLTYVVNGVTTSKSITRQPY